MNVCMYRFNEAQTMSLMEKSMKHFTFSFVSIQPSIHIYLSDISKWCIFYSKSFINHGFQYNSFCLVIVSSMDTTAKKRPKDLFRIGKQNKNRNKLERKHFNCGDNGDYPPLLLFCVTC